MHGGAAPQVKAAARERILRLVDPAIATLSRAVHTKGVPTAVEISAARDILDRAGLGAKQQIEMEVSRADGRLEQLLAVLLEELAPHPELKIRIASRLYELGLMEAAGGVQ